MTSLPHLQLRKAVSTEGIQRIQRFARTKKIYERIDPKRTFGQTAKCFRTECFGAAADPRAIGTQSLAAAVRPAYFQLLPIHNSIVAEAGPDIENKSSE